MISTPDYREVFYSAQDGLRLYARDYHPAESTGRTDVICLPGLTRSSADFADLAARLAQTRRVVCPDFRGRGLSAYAPTPESYTPAAEMADTLALAAAIGVHRAVFIGTSRGGIVSMLTAVSRPTILAGVVLNDIGPEVALAGLRRIAGYAGAQPPVAGWDGAAEQARSVNESQFPTFGNADWQAMARRLYVERDGRIVLAYDPQIGAAVRASTANADKVPPANLWGVFQAMAGIPCTVIHGVLSDVLTPDILQRMKAAKPDLEIASVPDRGHAPLLDEPEALAAIDAMLERADRHAA